MANLFDVEHDPQNLRDLPTGRYTIGRNVSLRVRYIAIRAGVVVKYAAWYHRYRGEDGKQRERNLGSAHKFSLDDAIAFRDSLPDASKPARAAAEPRAHFVHTAYQAPSGKVFPAWRLEGTRHAVAVLEDRNFGDGYVFYTYGEDDRQDMGDLIAHLKGQPLAVAMSQLETRAAKELV